MQGYVSAFPYKQLDATCKGVESTQEKHRISMQVINLFFFSFSFSEKPNVTLHTRVKSGLCIKKGEEIQIHAYISGSPYPKVTWLRNNEDVTKEPTKKIVPVLKKKKKTKVFVLRSLSPYWISVFKKWGRFTFLLFRFLNQKRSL